MVIREALQKDSANDGLTLTSRVRIVCQAWARWMSVSPRPRDGLRLTKRQSRFCTKPSGQPDARRPKHLIVAASSFNTFLCSSGCLALIMVADSGATAARTSSGLTSRLP